MELTDRFRWIHGIVGILLFSCAVHKHGYFKFFLPLKFTYQPNTLTKEWVDKICEHTVVFAILKSDSALSFALTCQFIQKDIK